MKKIILSLLGLLVFVPYLYSQQKASDQGAASGSIIPSGTVMAFAGATAPSGWVFAYGQEVSQTNATYKNLYTAIGSTYCTTEHGGTCTGGNFRLPDLRGRAIHGKDNMGGTAASRITTAVTIDGTVLGKSGGSQSFTIAAGNVPQVSGGYTPSGTVNSSSLAAGAHTHTYDSTTTSTRTTTFVDEWNNYLMVGRVAWTTSSDGSHSHTINSSFVGNAATITVGSASPSAISQLEPVTILNYIIKL